MQKAMGKKLPETLQSPFIYSNLKNCDVEYATMGKFWSFFHIVQQKHHDDDDDNKNNNNNNNINENSLSNKQTNRIT